MEQVDHVERSLAFRDPIPSIPSIHWFWVFEHLSLYISKHLGQSVAVCGPTWPNVVSVLPLQTFAHLHTKVCQLSCLCWCYIGKTRRTPESPSTQFEHLACHSVRVFQTHSPDWILEVSLLNRYIAIIDVPVKSVSEIQTLNKLAKPRLMQQPSKLWAVCLGPVNSSPSSYIHTLALKVNRLTNWRRQNSILFKELLIISFVCNWIKLKKKTRWIWKCHQMTDRGRC